MTLTVGNFWKNTLPLPEVTREGVFMQMADSGEGARCSKCIKRDVILCPRSEECKGHNVQTLVTDSSMGSGGVVSESQ